MAMTFASLQDSILHHMGDVSGATRVRVKRWLNDTRNVIWEQTHGNFKEQTDYLTTVVEYKSTTAITVLVTNGSPTVTSDGATDTAFTSAMAGRFMQLAGREEWYRILSVESATSLTLEDDFIGTTAAAAAFSIRTYLYPIATDVQRLLQVTVEREENWSPLEIIDRIDAFDVVTVPLRWDGGPAEICWLDEETPAGVKQLGIWPNITAASLVKYRYQKMVTEMTLDADTVIIPGADEVIKNGVLVEAYAFKGKMQQSAFYRNLYETERDRLLVTVSRSSPKWRRRDLTDAGGGGYGYGVNMGPSFPR